MTSRAALPTLPPCSLDDAPEASKPTLERLARSVGSIPNLAGAMAGSPALIEGFVALREAFHRSSLSPLEREVLALANAVENGCRYCTAIHATFAASLGLGDESIERLRNREDLDDPRLDALARFTRALIRGRGAVPAEDTRAFADAGFGSEQVLEVVLGAATSTLANYAGHVTGAEPDEMIRPRYR